MGSPIAQPGAGVSLDPGLRLGSWSRRSCQESRARGWQAQPLGFCAPCAVDSWSLPGPQGTGATPAGLWMLGWSPAASSLRLGSRAGGLPCSSVWDPRALFPGLCGHRNPSPHRFFPWPILAGLQLGRKCQQVPLLLRAGLSEPGQGPSGALPSQCALPCWLSS